jgi:hypothetical protein
MEDETIKRILEDNEAYDDSKESTIREMLSDFYSRKMMSIAIIVWLWAIIFLGGAIYSGVKFFDNVETKGQIMYATLFVCSFVGVGLMKVFAWQMIARNGIMREIKRQELRIVELTKMLAEK